MRKGNSNGSGSLPPKCRQSVYLTREQHDALEDLAKENGVSFNWIVRYACDQLLRQHRRKTLLNLEPPENGEGNDIDA